MVMLAIKYKMLAFKELEEPIKFKKCPKEKFPMGFLLKAW